MSLLDYLILKSIPIKKKKYCRPSLHKPHIDWCTLPRCLLFQKVVLLPLIIFTLGFSQSKSASLPERLSSADQLSAHGSQVRKLSEVKCITFPGNSHRYVILLAIKVLLRSPKLLYFAFKIREIRSTQIIG